MVITVKLGSDENIVHKTHPHVDIEMTDETVHAIDDQEHNDYLLDVAHEPNRQDDGARLDHYAIEWMANSMHHQIEPGRQVVCCMGSPQEFSDGATCGLRERMF